LIISLNLSEYCLDRHKRDIKETYKGEREQLVLAAETIKLATLKLIHAKFNFA